MAANQGRTRRKGGIVKWERFINCAENCAENEYDVPATEELEKAVAALMGEIRWTASLN